METPEKFNSPEAEEPEKPKRKLVRRVVARPIGDVRSVKEEEFLVIPREYEVPFKPPLAMPAYEEFDALEEMNKLSEESRVKTDVSPQERRTRLRAELQRLKETLARQEVGVGETVRDLERAIRTNPDATDLELFRRVAEVAPKYRFSNAELEGFWDAIVAYRVKHRNVEMCRNQFPNDAGLFEASFGRKPRGKVEVTKGPMLLYFHCHDDEDYVWANAIGRTGGDETKLTEEMRKHALASGGSALRSVKMESLAGTVAIERSSAVARGHREFIEDKTAMLAEGEVERLMIDDVFDAATIMVPDVGTFTLRFDKRGRDYRPTRVELYEGEGDGRVLLRAYDRIPNVRDEALGAVEDDQHITGASLTYEIRKGQRVAATVVCAYNTVRVTNRGKELVAVAYQVHQREWFLDKKRSDETRVHEEQHLMNYLFEPLAWSVAEGGIMARVARTAKTVGEAREMLMKELARAARQVMGIDNRTRGEILAYYKDGSTREYILEQLTQSSLYAYRDDPYYKRQIVELPEAIAEKIEQNMSTITYVVSPGASGEAAKGKMVHAGSLFMSPSEVGLYVEKAFGEDYKKDVARWVGAIGTLERKGYSRDDIVSMLYGERVPDWQAFARRAPEKKEA